MNEDTSMLVKSTISLHISSDYGDIEILEDLIESLQEVMQSYTDVILKGITLTEG
jgi:hypothetical protein